MATQDTQESFAGSDAAAGNLSQDDQLLTQDSGDASTVGVAGPPLFGGGPALGGPPAGAAPVPMLLGVRMFLDGAQHHLARYDLSRLAELTDGQPSAPGRLGQIVQCFRPDQHYVGGLDAVAVGLLAAGDRSLPIVYALRTFTTVMQDTVRMSNVAVDSGIAQLCNVPELLVIFAAQLPALATQLLPTVRYLTCEARKGGANYLHVVRNGLPVAPGKTLPFVQWDPPDEYRRFFPSSGPDMAYLRVDLRQSNVAYGRGADRGVTHAR
mmetsp:Transcript_3866/g.11420  ORF Transcript_3866/g.11420 Transcript_3866/m.11420 type:complete len:267 (+) Transcript_3866:169-969(+)